MERSLYQLIQKQQSFVPPAIRLFAYLDYHFERLARETKIFYWLPRLIGLSFIIFINLFTLKIFSSSTAAGSIAKQLVAGFFPSLFLLPLLLVAWKKELVGGAMFIFLFFIFMIFLISIKPLLSDIVFFGPFLLIGSLFIFDSYLNNIYKR